MSQMARSDCPSWRSPRAWFVLILVVAAGIGVDLGTKAWAFSSIGESQVLLDRSALIDNEHWSPIPPGATAVAIPGRILDFRLVLNNGAIFGIGARHRMFFIIFTTTAIIIAFWIFAKGTRSRQYAAQIALGLILAGGLGNLYDRIAIGRVRDFMHMFPRRYLPFDMTWPGGGNEWFPWVFNAGDVMLMIGMVVLIVYFWRQPVDASNK
jgi:signal peptidase II